MDVPLAGISVRSRREAMDLSLVLASQGIEHVVEHPNEEHGWRVVVDSRLYERGVESWRAYRAENRPSRWQQPLPFTGMVFDWRSFAWFAVLVVIFTVQVSPGAHLREAGLMHNAAVGQGEWWRLLTAVTLHSDAPHLIANVTTGVLLLGLAMGSLGPGIAVLAAFLSGVGGNVAGLIFYGLEHRSLGASGMVMGALGLMTGQTLGLLRHGEGARQFIARTLLGGFLLLVLLGLDPNTDVLAHIGGFVSGVMLGAAIGLWDPKLTHKPIVNRLAEAVCAALIIVAWWLALRSH